MTEHTRKAPVRRPAVEPPGRVDPADPHLAAHLAARAGLLRPLGVLGLQRAVGNAATVSWVVLQRGGPPGVVPPLAADDVVLTRRPGSAVAAKLPSFRRTARALVIAWGRAFNPAAVRLVSDGGATVMALRWSIGWGSRPTAASAGTAMRPVDARLAQHAAAGLAGWAGLAAADQTIVGNLLGGELNNLSHEVRESMRPTFLALRATSAVDQTTALRGLLGGAGAPAVVAENVLVKPVSVTLVGPTTVRNYAFRGTRATAEKWTARFGDGTVLTIIAPKGPTPGLHNHSVRDAADAARYLPSRNRTVLKKILLNAVTNPKDPYWAAQYKTPNFQSYMTAGTAGTLTIYPSATGSALQDTDYMRGTMIHESGHTWSRRTWGEDVTKGRWKAWAKAMTADKVSVSGYAGASIEEDVAETIQVYGSTRGTATYTEYRAIVPHRFAILEKELR